MPNDASDESASGPSPDKIRAALDAIVTSEIFNNSVRLQEFLTYVVEQRLAGLQVRIPAKIILEDVYKRTAGVSADDDNVVRVDAGRLRRRLDQYYLDAGKNDSVRIHIDPGGYVPRFEERSLSAGPDKQNGRSAVWVASLVLGAIVVAGFAFVLGSRSSNQSAVQDAGPSKPGDAAQGLRVLERQAILEKSPASLQTVNLAEQARGLIFPIFNVERLKLTTEMFRQAIAMDDGYFGGYAGAAQTLGTLALLSPPGPERESLQSQAREMAELATGIDPTHSWAQSAAAWVAFTGQDFDRAVQLSNRSVKLSPNDGNVLDFHALISLFTGDFESARDAADPDRTRIVGNQRFANRNIYAAANYHLGEYATTLESFKQAAELGDPISPPRLAFLAATYHAMGSMEEAERKAGELSRSWPDFRADLVLYRVYRHRRHADAVISRLRGAGWKPPTTSNTGMSSN